MSRATGVETVFRRDEDLPRFMGLVSELPERFGTEVHAFVLMDNHYHLLVRCRRTSVSETLRWLQTSYSVKFNWAHRRRGHVFQGRFKSVLIQDESRLGQVARYVHLNPVRITGLGLSKEDQRRARVLGWWRGGTSQKRTRVWTMNHRYAAPPTLNRNRNRNRNLSPFIACSTRWRKALVD